MVTYTPYKTDIRIVKRDEPWIKQALRFTNLLSESFLAKGRPPCVDAGFSISKPTYKQFLEDTKERCKDCVKLGALDSIKGPDHKAFLN